MSKNAVNNNTKKITSTEFKFKEDMIKCNHCNHEILISLINICDSCNLVFCIKHRLESDHKCKVVKEPLREKFLKAKRYFEDNLNKMKTKK